MPLFLTEADVRELLPMASAIERVEASFTAQHSGQGINRSRQRILAPHASLHFMAAGLIEEGWFGAKIYTITRQGFQFVVVLFDASSGALLAVIEADHLGRIRTGAASGVATKFMAREDARRVGLIGAGRQGITQLEAVTRVRKIEAVRVFSRDPERRRAFCRDAAERLKIPVEPVETAEAAVRSGDVVITATNASEPVAFGNWIQPGTHLNVIGANMANRREVDSEVLRRARILAVDSLEQAKIEAGDLIHGLGPAGRDWDSVAELHAIVAGARPGRESPQDVTLFKSSGIALWDVSVAGFIYNQALARGRGFPLPASTGN